MGLSCETVPNSAIGGQMGLSCEIVLAGRSSRRSTRPSFETQRALLRLKVVPTAFQPHLAGDCSALALTS